MSLILDALEQAERDRQGQPVQQRLAQATANPPDTRHARPGLLGWLIGMVGVAALALSVVLAWGRWGSEAPAGVTVQPGARDAVQLPALTAAPAQLAGTVLFTPAPAATPVTSPVTSPVASSAPPTQPAPAAPTQPAASASSATTARPALTAPAALATDATAVAAVPPAAPPTPATAPMPTASELPAQMRARLPSLTITGHTYSDNPTLRTLMIDGRMLVEGQTLSPGLRLERIERQQAVFNLEGTRFGVGY